MSRSEAISVVLERLRAEGIDTSFYNIIKNLQQTIIEEFQGGDLDSYWSQWRISIYNAARLDPTLQITRDNSDEVKLLFYSFFSNASPDSVQQSTKTDLSTTTLSNKRLSPKDKADIKMMYDGLIESKMWKLSTGKMVEKSMMDLAMKCDYEHPCHSLILDPEDRLWEEYFTMDELEEIAAYNAPIIPTPPYEFEQYLSLLQQASTAKECHQLALKESFDWDNEGPCAWIQSTICHISRLFIKGINFQQVSETDLLLRPFHFLSSVFDDSPVDADYGELASNATKAAMNKKRCIDSTGDKVDIIYRSKGVELGCVEAGREQRANTSTNEINIGHLKQPKVMKNMLCELVMQKPDLIGKTCIVGFTITGNKINMLLVDAPSSGYVARTTRTVPIDFPRDTLEFADGMCKLLTLAFAGRRLLEQTYHAYLSYKSSPRSSITINNRRSEPSCLLDYAFYSSPSPRLSSTPSLASSKRSRH